MLRVAPGDNLGTLVREVGRHRLTGAIAVERSLARLYFLDGTLRHAVAPASGGVVEGPVAFQTIRSTAFGQSARVSWHGLERIPRVSLEMSAADLVGQVGPLASTVRISQVSELEATAAPAPSALNDRGLLEAMPGVPRRILGPGAGGIRNWPTVALATAPAALDAVPTGADNRRERVPWRFPDVVALIALAPLFFLVRPGLRQWFVGLGSRPAEMGALFDVGADALVVVFIVGIACGLRRGSLATLGVALPREREWFVWAVVVGVAGTGIAAVATGLEAHAGVQLACDATGGYGGSLTLALIVSCLAAPLTEELWVRGFIFGWMRDHWGALAGAVISATIFGLLHIPNEGVAAVLPVGAFGAALAWLYVRSGSLLPGLLAHAIFNAQGAIAAAHSGGC